MPYPVKWPKALIRRRTLAFIKKHGREPITEDFIVDKSLPDPSTIRIKYGSLSKLRKALKLKTLDHTKGAMRSSTAIAFGNKARDTELDLYRNLCERFGEVAVHWQAPYSLTKPLNNRMDFRVYHSSGKINIDVFHAKNIKVCMNVVNLKLKTYEDFNGLIYFVCCNPEITISQINEKLALKHKRLPNNIKLTNYNEMLKVLKALKPLDLTTKT